MKKFLMKKILSYIKTYAKNKNCIVSDHDIKVIYNYIKKYSDDLLNKKDDCFNELKNEINPDIFNQITDLYNKYKDYI